MKISLINPNLHGEKNLPNLSIAAIMTHLNERTEHRASLIDLTFHTSEWRNYLASRLKEQKPDVVGISVYSFNYGDALRIVDDVKDVYPDIPIVFGGVHAILSSEEVIRNKKVDVVCTGEGEHTLAEYLDCLENGKDRRGVKGIWYMEGEKERHNDQRRLIEDLDTLPVPDWRPFELNKYLDYSHGDLGLMASRGCPYGCTYCSNNALRNILVGKYLRFQSPEKVIEDIQVLKERHKNDGFKYLFFYDDTFISHRKFVLEFCRQYKEHGFHEELPWNVNVRPNLVTDELIGNMADAGCYQVRMGVEAGDDYIRNTIYKRGMTLAQIRNSVAIIKRYNIQFRLQFILGAPGETIETMTKTFNLARELDPTYIIFTILQPLPKTEIVEIAERMGAITRGQQKSLFDSAVIETDDLSIRDVKRFKGMVENYYIRKYFMEGLKLAGPRFLLDSLDFVLRKKYRYDLPLREVHRFTIKKYLSPK